jgi:hypothetical protein
MPMSTTVSCSTHPWNFQRDELSAQSRPAQSQFEKRPPTSLRCDRRLRLLSLLWCGLAAFVFSAQSQTAQQEPLPGPDSHETGQGPHGHLFGTGVASARAFKTME